MTPERAGECESSFMRFGEGFQEMNRKMSKNELNVFAVRFNVQPAGEPDNFAKSQEEEEEEEEEWLTRAWKNFINPM